MNYHPGGLYNNDSSGEEKYRSKHSFRRVDAVDS
jgi:hypothetical protein